MENEPRLYTSRIVMQHRPHESCLHTNEVSPKYTVLGIWTSETPDVDPMTQYNILVKKYLDGQEELRDKILICKECGTPYEAIRAKTFY